MVSAGPGKNRKITAKNMRPNGLIRNQNPQKVTDDGRDKRERPNKIAGGWCGVDTGVHSGHVGTGTKSARIFCRHSAAYQPGRWHHHSQRAGRPTAESISRECAVKEYRDENRAFTEGRY